MRNEEKNIEKLVLYCLILKVSYTSLRLEAALQHAGPAGLRIWAWPAWPDCAIVTDSSPLYQRSQDTEPQMEEYTIPYTIYY
jgi:hypothetical protein